MIPIQIALIDASGTIDPATLTQVAAALSQQAHDFTTAWHSHYRPTITAHTQAAGVEAGTWNVQLQDGIDQQGAAGYHSDQNHQPYAIVDLTAGEWTVTASHEILEMLGDPYGNFLHAAAAPDGWPGPPRVRYLREVCDPCEATTYETGGVRVSDFLLAHYYRTLIVAGDRYSFASGVTRPRQVADGGYISWVDPASGEWWQRFVENGVSSDRSIGTFDHAAFASLREFTDHHARQRRG